MRCSCGARSVITRCAPAQVLALAVLASSHAARQVLALAVLTSVCSQSRPGGDAPRCTARSLHTPGWSHAIEVEHGAAASRRVQRRSAAAAGHKAHCVTAWWVAHASLAVVDAISFDAASVCALKDDRLGCRTTLRHGLGGRPQPLSAASRAVGAGVTERRGRKARMRQP